MQKLYQQLRKTRPSVHQNSNGSLIISLGADCASVMSGRLAGVAELLRSRYFKWLVYIHCTPHRKFGCGRHAKDTIINRCYDHGKSCHTLFSKPKTRQKYESLHREIYPSKQVKHITQQINIRWGCQ